MQHILQEVAAGVLVSQLARNYDPCTATIHLWLRERQPADADLEAQSDRERELQKQDVHLERQEAFFSKRRHLGLPGNARPCLAAGGVSIDRRLQRGNSGHFHARRFDARSNRATTPTARRRSMRISNDKAFKSGWRVWLVS